MRRQGLRRIVELRIQSRCFESAIIENLPGGNVAGLDRYQQQHRNRGAAATIALPDERMARKTAMPVCFGGRRFTLQFEGPRQTLMRLRQVRPARESSLILLAGSRKLAVFEQYIAQIDSPDRIIGMTLNGAGVSGLRRRTMAARQRQSAEFIERREMAVIDR